ncbi:MAG: transglycosylase SLT domain-containing protein, partial [Gemmatimonadales bacterium]
MQQNPPKSFDLRRPDPRRPFIVALALAGFAGGVELTPPFQLDPIPVTTLTAAPPVFASIAAAPPDSAALERQVVARFAHQPLARFLGRHTREPGMANRIARAIVREARRLQVEPSLLTGVLLTENTRLEVKSVSSQGAIGLMQVMHFHAGEFDCGSDDLVEVESNICHGARVFGRYLERTGDVKRALLRYNG